jgi:hypothetical protein
MHKVKVNRSVMLGLGTGGRVLKLGEATLTDEEMALPATKRYIESGIIKVLSRKPKQGKLNYSGIPRVIQTPQGPKVADEPPVAQEKLVDDEKGTADTEGYPDTNSGSSSMAQFVEGKDGKPRRSKLKRA